MARDVEEIEFVPADTQRVVGQMSRLAGAGSGWINFLPGVEDEEETGPARPSVFSALFGSSQPPVTMCTWMPARAGRRRGEDVTIGIMHPRGRRAVTQLRDLGAPLPGGWHVRQDHARRGLIVLAPSDSGHAQVLDWTLRAGAALAMTALTGSWKARVFQPDRG